MGDKIYLDNFTKDSVDLRMQGNELWRRSYANSIIDRQLVEQEVIEPYKSVIFMMWGDSPSITE